MSLSSKESSLYSDFEINDEDFNKIKLSIDNNSNNNNNNDINTLFNDAQHWNFSDEEEELDIELNDDLYLNKCVISSKSKPGFERLKVINLFEEYLNKKPIKVSILVQ